MAVLRSQLTIALLSFALSAIVFAMDMHYREGFAGAILYALPIAISAFARSRLLVIVLGLTTITLTALKPLALPALAEMTDLDWMNRTVAISLILGSAGLALMLLQDRYRLSLEERRFQDIANIASDWFWEMDARLCFTYLSDSFENITGTKPAKVLGKSILELGPEKTGSQEWEQFVQLIRLRKPFRNFRYVSRTKNGRTLFMNVNGIPVFTEGGKFQGYRGTAQDITTTIQSTSALRAHEAYSRVIVENALDGLLTFDADGKILTFNPAAERIFGYHHNVAIGKDIAEIFPKARTANEVGLASNFIGMVDKLHDEAVEMEAFDKNGVSLTVHLGLSATEINGERRYVASVLDMTNIRRTGEELKETQTTLLELSQVIEDVIWVRRPGAQKFLFVSPAYEKLWGHPIEELEKNPTVFLDYVHPDDMEKVLNEYQLHGENGSWFCQYRIIRSDGTTKWVQDRGYPIYDSRNQIQRIIGHVTDISNLKEYEQSLIAARNRAVKADQEKSEFLSQMSHEIRTPMNGIIGLVEMLTDFDLEEEQAKIAHQLLAATGVVEKLLGDIQDYNQLQNNKINLKEQSFSPARVVEGVYSLVTYAASTKNLKLTLEIDEQVPQQVIGDQIRLSQVLLNLVDNAIRYTAEGAITCKVTPMVMASYVTGSSYGLRFQVIDTGIGIREDKLEDIFNPFFQHNSGSVRKDGSGMGLSITRKLVHLMGGEITAESDGTTGSTFTVTLPFTVPDSYASSHTTIDGEPHAPRMGQLHILLAEDNEINAKIAKAMLTGMGHRVDQAVNGTEAVSLASSHDYDIIMMDIMMPEMDGIEATKRIRRLSGSRGEVPIVAVTANAMANDRETCLANGMNDYISKPFRKPVVVDVLNRTVPSKKRPVLDSLGSS